MTNNNALGYRRLSEKDQSRYSLEYQDKAITDYCNRYDLNLIGVYTDNGECSDTFDRPDYQALESFIKKHKGKARYLIIMDHDRFSRNLPEALMKIDELEDKHGIKVLASNEDVNLDTKDPAVFMQRAFNYLIANQELLRIRKRTKDGIRQAQSQGRYVNRAPFGYNNLKDEGKRGVLIIDEAKADIVRLIFEQYLSGASFYDVHQKAKEIGFHFTGNGAIQKVLGNCTYAGLVKVNGDRKTPDRIVKGLHQPIIGEADYWLVQERLENKRPSKAQPKEEFPLRGILKCWCGKSMTAGFSKGKTKYYLYYRCTQHTETNIPGYSLHDQFESLLDLLSFTKDQADYISERSRVLLKEAWVDNAKVLLEREKQLKDIDRKIDKLEERLMDDEIDGGTYKKWKQKFSQEKAVILKDIDTISQESKGNKLEKLNRLLPLMTSIKSIYKEAPLRSKHAIVRGVFKHKLVYIDGMFRTPSMEPAFHYNSLKAKEKGLLEIEEPFGNGDLISFCSP
ncbi:MAG: recombinase family protein [Candidatus Pedobacter colombiensis]|uniref:Recombinase family protein n=1 Tax=Candidatus Pedobacter colombiensis TaxID=3121371 RepID=A0AAJ5W8A1_9SPHI|nr:recombinase family protein [Pedobacter sp.]WEK18869.1 MAG: recombinase family protein [Pedobacter sp.]